MRLRLRAGTYNNQYMVVDLKRFSPGQPLKEGLLTIVEVIPGACAWVGVRLPAHAHAGCPCMHAWRSYIQVRLARRGSKASRSRARSLATVPPSRNRSVCFLLSLHVAHAHA